MKPRHGEVWLADLGLAAKTRPVVILSADDTTWARDLFIYVPISTQNRQSAAEVDLSHVDFLRQKSVVNVQGIGAAPIARFEKCLGALDPETLAAIKSALAKACGMGTSEQAES